jgi:uncharacterized protein YukE
MSQNDIIHATVYPAKKKSAYTYTKDADETDDKSAIGDNFQSRQVRIQQDWHGIAQYYPAVEHESVNRVQRHHHMT